MKKLVLVAAVAAFAVAVPAQAHDPGEDRGGSSPSEQGQAGQALGEAKGHSTERGRGEDRGGDKGRGEDRGGDKSRGESKSRRCSPRRVAYVASGSYVSSTLTQTKGADTADDRSDDRFSGPLTIAVKRTNRHANADEGTTKTYALVDARIKLADRNDDGTRDAPVAGDRTVVHGKITKLRRGCDATAFTPELKIKKVMFRAPADEPDEPAAPATPTS